VTDVKYQRLRGVKDTFPPESLLWEHAVAKIFGVLKNYGYRLILTPVIEEKALFSRGIGEASDMVMKEMYDFKDKKGRDIVLRPEGTASVVRAYIENSLPEKSDLCYIGQMFRYEKPQKGRNREFYQIGVESFGDASPYKDAEVIKLASDILVNAGITGCTLRLNTLYCAECGPGYLKALEAYLKKNSDKLCDSCKNKMERAPIRVLDCKNPACREVVAGAPKIAGHLCGKCKTRFSEIKGLLSDLKVDFTEDPLLVRGLDYYTGVVFEFVTDKLGPQQNTVLAGGRYDNLVHELGGKNTPATGFALGIERLIEVMQAEAKDLPVESIDAFIVADEKYIKEAFMIVNTLRENNIKAGMSFDARSFKSQFREADSRKSAYTVIIGENEIKNKTVMLKNMATGEQKEVKAEELVSNLESFLKTK
jgi:histidyl-tRNA synthetase